MFKEAEKLQLKVILAKRNSGYLYMYIYFKALELAITIELESSSCITTLRQIKLWCSGASDSELERWYYREKEWGGGVRVRLGVLFVADIIAHIF